MLSANYAISRQFDKLKGKRGFARFFEPPSLDGRIVNQGAVLSIMPGASLDLKIFLEAHPDSFKKIIVRKNLKWEIRDKLDQDESTSVFYSLASTARRAG